MSRYARRVRLGWCVTWCMGWLLGVAIAAQAMPAQVIIIRHAEKYEDREKIHLNPQGHTRARALAQFFQTDQRVLEHGVVSAIVAQGPSLTKKSVRCEETVEPLACALGQSLIRRFAYGQVKELVEWLRASREWDSKSGTDLRGAHGHCAHCQGHGSAEREATGMAPRDL